MDECQNGKFDAAVDFYDEFWVNIPSNIDPLSGSAFAASLAATKAAATQQQNHWALAAAQYSALFDVYEALTILSIATDPADFLLFACTNINFETGTVYCSLNDAWAGLQAIRNGVISTIVNQSFYYKGIAADPPDPNFTQLPVLADGLQIDLQVTEPSEQTAFEVAEIISQGTSLTHALLQAMERYQGAEEAGIGEDAFRQARLAEDYARQLAAVIPRVNAAFADLATEVESSGIDFVSVMDDYRATQARVGTSGLTAEERVKLLSEGWSEQNVADGVADYLDRDFSGLTTSTDMSVLAASMAADEAAAVAALNAFGDDMATAQSNLAAQLLLPYPSADAGGPYATDEGVPVILDASTSTFPATANGLKYAWDLDLDGEFDDAAGQAPGVTFNREMDGYIGLQVTSTNNGNPTPFTDVGYARVTVGNVNSAPQVTTANPSGTVVIPYNGTQTFSLTATDPDGDTPAYAWDFDGNPVGAGGTSYTYTATIADVGEHVVTVTVSDGSPLSPDAQHFWQLSVTGLDADGDGFPSNVDCDDNNAAVNPGVTEVPYNGVDDDCDPATPDDPDVDDDGYDFTQDCDDNDASVYPGAAEICNGKDDNCNGTADEGYDNDGDGVTTCGGDCNDTNPTVYPGAPELCDLIDNNCDGNTDEGLDGDGDRFTVCAGDCNDADADVFPGNVEACDLKDNNCDGSVDEGFDLDGDGYSQCAVPTPDCDDADATSYPGALELCDSVDNNCNGDIDEGVNDDLDGDGYSICGGDCNDAHAAIRPGAVETCDRIDNNCNGGVDEGFDLDGDGFSVCAVPVADCDDGDASVYPGAVEVFHNGRDDDCNPVTPDDYAATFVIATDDNGREYYANFNGDGTWASFTQLDSLPGLIRGAAIADFDNDGDLDFLIPANPGGNTLDMYLICHSP